MSVSAVSVLDPILTNNARASSAVADIAARIEEMKPQLLQHDLETSPKIAAVVVEEQADDGVVSIVEQFSPFRIKPELNKPIVNPNDQRLSGNVDDLTSFFRAHPNLESLTLEDCRFLRSIELSETLRNLHSLTLVNLPLLEPNCFSKIMDALPWGRWPNLKRLTIKNCPLFDDGMCVQIAKMLQTKLTHLVLEDVPNITSQGIGCLIIRINRQIGHLDIESIQISGLHSDVGQEVCKRLQDVLETNNALRARLHPR